MSADGDDRPGRVAELGEFPLIRRLASRLSPPGGDVLLGIGDDVAAVRIGPDRLLLVTCDVQVAGSHFIPDRCHPGRLGRKAAAINLSDMAAAGGRPTHFLCSLVVPEETPVSFLDAFYDGLNEEASRWGADVIGGNVSRGPVLLADLTLLGEASPKSLLRRDRARAGDWVAVTGRLGAAAAGLHLTRYPERTVAPVMRRRALDAFELPTPRLAESRVLVETGGVSAAIDISDGLAADLLHLCEASRVGVRVEASRIPVDPAAGAVAASADEDALAWALAGGEDYELLFTAPPDRIEPLADAVGARIGTPVTVVGELLAAEAGCWLVPVEGPSRTLSSQGWSHF